MTKCDGCVDRLGKGLKPSCVDSCPMRALEFGPIEQLREKYGKNAEIQPLPSASITQPNIVVKSNRNARDDGKVLNPFEV